MDNLMQVWKIFLHRDRLFVEDAAMAGGAYQLDDRKQDNIRLLTNNVVIGHLFQIIFIKSL